MSAVLRLFLLLSAAVVLALVIRKIKKSEFQSGDALFWLVVCVLFVLFALVPHVVFACSDLLGFESPSNFVFLSAIAILLIRLFSLNATVATLRNKLNRFVEEYALREHNEEDDTGR